jgi:DNA-binding transcriptional MerR regulator
MNVKQLSEATGLSPHTIRYYEKAGLILDVKRNANGFRQYAKADVEWIEALKALKAIGMSLADIKHLVFLRKQGDSTIDDRIKVYEQHVNNLQVKMNKLRAIIAEAKGKISLCKTSQKINK